MPTRNRMTMRATVARTVVSDPSAFNPEPVEERIYGGNPLDILWGSMGLTWDNLRLQWGAAAVEELLPCYVQPQQERTIGSEGKFYSVINYLMLCPIGADLESQDRVTLVETKRATLLYERNFRVLAPPMRREDHLEALLEAVT